MSAHKDSVPLANAGYMEGMYQDYLRDPELLDASWRGFFEGFELGRNGLGAGFSSPKETSVRNLIYAFRSRAHLRVRTNPVRPRQSHVYRLELSDFGLEEQDLDSEFSVGSEVGLGRATLRKIIEFLKRVYETHIGFEYSHIRDANIFDWFKIKCETEGASIDPPWEEKKRILDKLIAAEAFESFLHTKFLGQKRFSIEGAENTIPFLDKVINSAAEFGVDEVMIGMAHRGRLNVLANIMGKTYNEIFTEFQGGQGQDPEMGDGDVKYHLGYSAFIEARNGKKVYVKLAPNPSHLEAITPIILGYTRAQIDDEYRGDFKRAIPVIIHGDASIAGQGVVYECVQMSQLPGYTTGGTIHFVVNNQVGFTTNFFEGRSSIYCTDLAKIVDAPVLHVNGDNAEAINFAARVAVEYRQEFAKDIFVDMLCYRRHGHNEADEPRFTQPTLYELIQNHPSPKTVYVNELNRRGVIDRKQVDELNMKFRAELQDRLTEVKKNPLPYPPQKIEAEWHPLRKSTPQDFVESPQTYISEDLVTRVGKAITTLPKGFNTIRQIDKVISDRKNGFFEKRMLKWADGELLAYGSLLSEGRIVRISGQDVIRGTFSHRHAYVYDQKDDKPYCGLDHITEDQEPLRIYNSILSEFGVLGFEYGYAMATPNALMVWEAQFGDFANGAQVIIDQFISTAETKWQRMNGLVIFLPHGYEGQGPEHSSARIERILQNCAQENIVVCVPTTPANLFHMLRRQVAWEFRKPCVAFTPKSLLRHPKVLSPIEDFTSKKFQEVIADQDLEARGVKRVLMCCGKVYYDLLEARGNRKDVAILRIEQLYPFPKEQLNILLSQYQGAKAFWVQEEPENMGSWDHVRGNFQGKIEVIARGPSCSPSTGFLSVHRQEQQHLVDEALKIG